MEMKVSGPGEAAPGAGAGCKKQRPSRLQKHAPASLQLEHAAGAGPGPAAWGDGRAPIPLLSPLVVSPTAPLVWEADQGGADRREGGGGEQQRGAARHGGNVERQEHDAPPKPPPPAPGAGWRHPALPTPAAVPASLVPLFQSQCAVEVRNAQQ
ncbi:uncharacterized protein LOC133916427 [Phragmites australis]|uniref:uncharacterized protein LOC133916427 n=1 Tax=Phragmites australis TaxID=29695 RepID=UPI002D76E743|nr:uncharacterized protein LOC133916427 [Phragmites australis]